MKTLLITLTLLFTSVCYSGQSGFYVEGEIFAFDDTDSVNDYKGLSPFGSYAIKYKKVVSDDFSVNVGLKHQSSTGYREEGKGFNGPFVNFELKIF